MGNGGARDQESILQHAGLLVADRFDFEPRLDREIGLRIAKQRLRALSYIKSVLGRRIGTNVDLRQDSALAVRRSDAVELNRMRQDNAGCTSRNACRSLTGLPTSYVGLASGQRRIGGFCLDGHARSFRRFPNQWG